MNLSKRLITLEKQLPLEVHQRLELAKALDAGSTMPVVLRGGSAAKGADTFDQERGTGIFKITTPTVDRFDDVVVPAGMDNKNFRKNPVVLWNHDDSRPPIGKSLGEEVHEDAVLSETAFDLRNDPDGFNTKIFGQYVDGVMNTTSIRFLPMRAEKRLVEDAESGAKVWGGGFTFEAWELLEYSAVPLPANPDALALSAPAVLELAQRTGVLSHAQLANLLKAFTSDEAGLLRSATELAEALATLKAALPTLGPPAVKVAPTAAALDGGAADNVKLEAALERAVIELQELATR